MRKITFEESVNLQLDLLKEIDQFCKSRNIEYYLAYGTLLGAVRHHGHIPWDDDTDIMMLRKDYDRFFSEYAENGKYKTVTISGKDGHCFSFGRITNKETCDIMGKSKWHGENIDIYPLDNIPDDEDDYSKFKCEIEKEIDKQNFLIRLYRGFTKRNIAIFATLTRWLLVSHSKRFERLIRKYDNTETKRVSNLPCIKTVHPYEKDIFVQRDMSYEGEMFKVPCGYDRFLSIQYGNYMQLPPEEKRHPYHGANYYWL